jgi:hypothetical protein
MADSPAPITDNTATAIAAPTPLTAAAAEKAKAGLSKAAHDQQKELEGAIGQQGRLGKDYLDRMDSMVKAEGATIKELPHQWNTQQELQKRETSLWEDFGSPGFIAAMIGSAFSARPMNSALMAGGAALNAIKQNKTDDYERAFEAWKSNSDLAIKRMNMEHQQIQDIAHLAHTSIANYQANLRGIAAKYDNQGMIALMDAGYFDKVEEIIAKMPIIAEKVQKATDELNIRKAGMDALKDSEEYKKGDLQKKFDMQLETEKRIRDGEHPGRAGSVVSRESTRRIDAWDINHPKATEDERAAAHDKIISDVSSASKTVGELTPEKMKDLGWSEKAINIAAETFNATGKLPTNLGTRQFAGQIMGRIQERAAQMLEDKGQSAQDRARQWQRYSTEKTAQNRFMGGPRGDTIRSLNVVVMHLDTMERLTDALRNGDIPRFNAIAQQWAEETGKEAPTNFDAAKQIVGTEIMKALVGSGAGTGAEREEAANSFQRARSPQQLYGAIHTTQILLGGQLKGLKRQFMVSTGLPEGDFNEMLEPQTRLFLEDTSSSKPGVGGTEVPDRVEQNGHIFEKQPDGSMKLVK